MSKNNYQKQEKEFKEITKDVDLLSVKDVMSKIIPEKMKLLAKNDNQKKLMNSIRQNEITIVKGPPGCGKTFVSVGFSLGLLRKKENRFKKIYLVKSVTTLKGEEVGFLKGDLKEKIEPVMWSFTINMEKLIKVSSINKLYESDIIRPFPLAYMRGASFDDCIIIADEMQNVSLDNSRTLLTRIGSNCKLILLGDTKQIDIKNKKISSLEKLLEMFKDTKGIGVINMNEGDTENIRNPLITVIEKTYDEYGE